MTSEAREIDTDWLIQQGRLPEAWYWTLRIVERWERQAAKPKVKPRDE